jgi:hypothetical protein
MAPKKERRRKRPTSKAAGGRKKTAAKTRSAGKKSIRKKKRIPSPASTRKRLQARAAGQSGDLQGLSKLERADSQSVEELLEEGNAFEANVVTGVEAADDADEKEVRTHEVPEDDVPGEYLDKDS